MRCNPPCMAWVRKSLHAVNLNRIVSVHPEFVKDEQGRHMWLVSSNEPMPGVDLAQGVDVGLHYEKLWCADENLTPINDPGLKDDETDIVAPIVEKKEWEFPKENEHV